MADQRKRVQRYQMYIGSNFNSLGSFDLLFPHLKPGGLYFIEDCEDWGSKIQKKTRNDLLNYSNSSFQHLKNYDEIEFAELLFSKKYIDVRENFVLGIIRKSEK